MMELDEFKKYLKIFVVDDSQMARTGLVEVLEKHGYTVLGSSASAQECLENLHPETNLFIVDVVMPDISGIELCELITQKIKNTHVILISSLGHEHVLFDAISAGAKDFLLKPFEVKDLLAAVEKMAITIGQERAG